MFRKLFTIMSISSLLFLCSCSNPLSFIKEYVGESNSPKEERTTEISTDETTEAIEEVTTTEEVVEYTKYTTNQIEISNANQDLLYQNGQDAYVTREGALCGTVHFNQVQKLGIWDYTNQEVVNNGVYHSYTFNLQIDFSKYLENLESAKIEIMPNLIDQNGESLGEITVLGWSGFDSVAELYKNSPNKTIEICLQPTENVLPDGSYVLFEIKDTENNVVFDSVKYDLTLLQNAVDGPTIRRVNEPIKIKSINGAKYQFNLTNVCVSQSYLNVDNYSDLVKTIDIQYGIKLLKDKLNDRVVGRFNTFDGVQMNSEIKLAVNTSNNGDFNYTWFANATRSLYSDVDEFVPYVTSNFPFIRKGEEIFNTTNRVLSYDLDSKNPVYARISLEFEDERKARTDEEMLSFKGRYLVYQVLLEDRELPEYYTG